jgi:DNA sulfur modification protein DndD
MREETVNRRITNAIDQIPLEPLQQFLKKCIRFERSKMDKDQPYFRTDYRGYTQEFAPEDPSQFNQYDGEELAAAALSDSTEFQTAASQSDPIQIFNIRLHNWRQYGGEQEVDLSSQEGRLINVIEGENGAGKSNLLNAITFCFYGKEVQEQSDEGDLEKLPYVTRSRLDGADPGDTVEGFIEISLGIDQPEYLFRREFLTEINKDGSFSDGIGDLELRRKVSNEWKRTDNPSSYLNQVLPARVSDYFLFDGEDLDGFFDEGYAERVEDAILDVSHLGLLNKAQYHLGKIRSDIESEASDTEGEAAEIRKEVERIENQIAKKREELSDVEADIEETQENIRAIDTKLKDVSDEYVKNRYDIRESLREEVKKLEERRKDVQKDVKDLLVEVGPTIYARKSLLEAYDELDAMSTAESIPPKIQRRFIDELIERGECICGRPIEEGEHKAHLEDLRQNVFDVSEAQLGDSSLIPTIFENANEQVDRLLAKRQELADIEDEIDQTKSSIQNITDELKAYEIPDDVDIGTLESNRDELDMQLEELREHKARLRVEIEDLEEDLKDRQSELKAELDKQEEYRELRAELAIVDLAEDCIDWIKEDILADIREQTEANLQSYFNQLIWKDEEYTIELHSDYSIEVLDPFGDNKIGSLSAGETQVLALSFMAALTRISGFSSPVVIDTPLGRISSTPKSLIAQNLPKYMENTQITFLMTDEEYTTEVQSQMKAAIAREYQLVYDESETRVVPHERAQEVDL